MVFIGSKAKDVMSKGFHVVPLYGKGKKKSFKNIAKLTEFVQHLIFKGLIVETLPNSENNISSTYLSPGCVTDITVTYSM